MKLAIALLAVTLMLAGITAGCGGSPSVTCQTTMCSSTTSTYQVCANADGTETLNFGGMSCTCSGGAQCQACTSEVANYCSGVAGGSGGTGGGGAGGGGGGGGQACMATFSGAVTGTAICAVTITYTSAGSTIATAGTTVGGYSWTGFNMTVAGMPATGSWDEVASVATADTVNTPGSATSPFWEAGYGSGHQYGTASLTITDLGPETMVSGMPYYQSPHGSWTATLVDQTGQQPTITQSATF
jgi:hypothetical protein